MVTRTRWPHPEGTPATGNISLFPLSSVNKGRRCLVGLPFPIQTPLTDTHMKPEVLSRANPSTVKPEAYFYIINLQEAAKGLQGQELMAQDQERMATL